MSSRVYTQKTGAVEQALSLAGEVLDIPASASDSKRLQAVAEYFVEHTQEDIAREAKVSAYAAMAADNDRQARVKSNTRARVSAGLL